MGFNTPLRLRKLAPSQAGKEIGGAIARRSRIPEFRLSGAPNVFIDTVKRGDDDSFSALSRPTSQTVILRLFEAFGGQGQATITRCALAKPFVWSGSDEDRSSLDLADASVVDILERLQEPVELDGNKLKVKMRPFQVLTLRLVIQSA